MLFAVLGEVLKSHLFHVILYGGFISSCHVNLLLNLLLAESFISVFTA